MLAFMEFQRVVQTRRMVRDFKDEPLPAGELDRIVANALRGPSAGFTQGVELLVLEGAQQTSRYWEACFPVERRRSFRWPGVLRAPALVVVYGHEAAYVDRYSEADKAGSPGANRRWPAPWWHVDAAFAALLLLLSATDAGLGALFFSAFHPEALAREFGIPAGFTPTGVVAIGHTKSDDPSASVSRGRRPLAEVVHRGNW